MQARRRRIDLLRRLGRMREVEKHGAAMRAAEAHGAHGKLLTLRDRSGEIADHYASRDDAGDGAELATQLGFQSGLETIQRETEAERMKASQSSEQATQNLVLAERRLELTGERHRAAKRAIDTAIENRESSTIPVLARKLNRL